MCIRDSHMVAPEDPGSKFDKHEYYNHPSRYTPVFHERYLPYISVLFHCMYWEQKYPRLIAEENLKELAHDRNLRLLGIQDITCDIEGSIDILKKSTHIDDPFFMYDPLTGNYFYEENVKKAPTDCILYGAVDYLPTELAWDSSHHFGHQLEPFIESIALSDVSKSLEESGLKPEIKRAVITLNGELTPDFHYLIGLRKAKEELKKNRGYKPRGLKPMKKVGSFCSIRLHGHLFDTLAINKFVDFLAEKQIEFNFTEWKIGDAIQKSTVTLQLYTRDMEIFNNTVEGILALAQKHNVDVEVEQRGLQSVRHQLVNFFTVLVNTSQIFIGSLSTYMCQDEFEAHHRQETHFSDVTIFLFVS
eukprot:TRINITY_DN5118_c0_g1_i6.p1 TRINITY_DN5118_c0_g1~~TRINITY_DN5118_c0_g1_i6.p1  ORF type:complete len:360 (-),score=86.57 TRINITY_DN5118_c0_g1_i6:234-1313(-)